MDIIFALSWFLVGCCGSLIGRRLVDRPLPLEYYLMGILIGFAWVLLPVIVYLSEVEL